MSDMAQVIYQGWRENITDALEHVCGTCDSASPACVITVDNMERLHGMTCPDPATKKLLLGAHDTLERIRSIFPDVATGN